MFHLHGLDLCIDDDGDDDDMFHLHGLDLCIDDDNDDDFVDTIFEKDDEDDHHN